MNHLVSLATIFTFAALAPASSAQGLLGFLPFEHTGDLYVTDSSTDSIKRLVDLNMDGDYNGLGEVTDYYSDAVGPVALGNNSGITVDIAGRLYVSDTTEDSVFVMHDANGNGNCHDAGEMSVFFDGDPLVNLSGIDLVSPGDLTADLLGNIWVAEANNSGGGVDSIIKLTDLNGDGDANDLGEGVRYFIPNISGSTGDSIPNDVFVGQDGFLYYVEGGSTGFIAKDVWRLDDANGDGVIDPVTEVSSFFSPPAQAGTAFFWSLTQDGNGNFYTADTGNDLIWKFSDVDGNGVVDPVTEATIWWDAAGAKSLIWDVTAASDGSIYAAESQSPDRILRFVDSDGSGVIDQPGETIEVYSELVSATNIANPRGVIFEQAPNLTVGTPVAVGGTFSADTRATMGDVVTTWWSSGAMAPLPLAPFGNLELSLLPGDVFGILYTGVIGNMGSHSVSMTLPSDPALSGLSFYMQGFVGKPDRFQLTNLVVLSIL